MTAIPADTPWLNNRVCGAGEVALSPNECKASRRGYDPVSRVDINDVKDYFRRRMSICKEKNPVVIRAAEILDLPPDRLVALAAAEHARQRATRNDIALVSAALTEPTVIRDFVDNKRTHTKRKECEHKLPEPPEVVQARIVASARTALRAKGQWNPDPESLEAEAVSAADRIVNKYIRNPPSLAT